ncbi:MAG: S-layer homology domain-containing protein [Clostridia bacterium]|nr:S-layer homology domain-containing protein [Clostridia bacterium]
MKTMLRKIISLTLVCVMLLPLCATSVGAMTLDGALEASWTAMAAKYSGTSNDIIAPMESGYQIKTDGFDFKATEEGGIKVTTPDYATFPGVYGVSAVTSNATTPLDGLSVVITPDEFDSLLDSDNVGNTIGILWTEEKIDGIAQMNVTGTGYSDGLWVKGLAAGSGLQNLIPKVENYELYVPASQTKNPTNGQALYISVGTSFSPSAADGTPVASVVTITYYDGYYVNDDKLPGHTWKFRARNMSKTTYSDATRISQDWEYIDLSEGLAVNVRADAEHGFIVNINGYDYYKGEDVAYFPDARQKDGKGYAISGLNETNILGLDKVWLDSMSYARQDIDLTGLATAGNGYLTIGAISNADKNLTVENGAILDHKCNYTINTINGYPAATWNGETLSADHVCEMAEGASVAVSCTRDGGVLWMCKTCGKCELRDVVPATGHTMPAEEERLQLLEGPTCAAVGTKLTKCATCTCIIENEIIPKLPHQFDESQWIVESEATCEDEGKRTNTCLVCFNSVTEETPAFGHDDGFAVVLEEATCESAGITKIFCTTCWEVIETIEGEGEGGTHTFDDTLWTVAKEATCTEDGERTNACTVCGQVISEAIPATGHTLVANEAESYAKTCTADGLEVADCSVCGEKVSTVIPAAHDVVADEAASYAATCTTDGKLVGTCQTCGEAIDETITAPGHTWDSEYVCTVCGEAPNPKATIGDVLYANLTDAFAAAEDGDVVVIHKTSTDKNVDYTITKDITIELNDGVNIRTNGGIPALIIEADVKITGTKGTIRASDAKTVVVNSGSLTIENTNLTIRCSGEEEFSIFEIAEGAKVYINASGGRYYRNPTSFENVVIAEGLALCEKDTDNYTFCGHTKSVDYVKAPGCLTEGATYHVCPECNFVSSDNYTAATGHTWGEWEVTVEPTQCTTGVKVRSCSGCDAIEEMVVPATGTEHAIEVWVPVIETVDGTIDWYGAEFGVCTICGAEETRVVESAEYVAHFEDLKADQWYVSEVAYCVSKGYIKGMNDTTFAPNKNLTRAEFLTLLAKVDGVDLTQYDTTETGFEDVKTSHWYNEVVAWAVENELTSGISETQFGPNVSITRSQLARFFKLYTEKKGYDVSAKADLASFVDAGKVQEWAADSVEWAVAMNLISGVGNDMLAPNATATRAQAARMIMIYTTLEFSVVEPAE